MYTNFIHEIQVYVMLWLVQNQRKGLKASVQRFFHMLCLFLELWRNEPTPPRTRHLAKARWLAGCCCCCCWWWRGHYISAARFHYCLLFWRTLTEEGSVHLYVFTRTKQPQSKHCIVLEHVALSEFFLHRQINAQHRHQRTKTLEKQGSFCKRKQKRIGHTAQGASQCIPSVPEERWSQK